MQNINELIPKKIIAKEMLILRRNMQKIIFISIFCVFVSGLIAITNKYALAVFVALYAVVLTFIIVPNQREIQRLELDYGLGEVVEVKTDVGNRK